MPRLRQIIIVSLVAAFVACRSNPFGDTDKTIEEFNLYTTDFAAQNDGGMKTALLEVIGGSRVTLNCAFSALTLTDVTNAIIDRARGGVQVKIAFDGDVRTNDPGSLALQASGAFTIVTVPLDGTQSQLLYGNTGAGVMRHNYCLADERYIYLSTAPPDATQMTTTPNVAIKVGTPQFGLARDFLRESNMFSQLLFGNGKAKTDFTTKFTARDQVIGAFWGPQESPLNVLAVELSEATSRVDFYSTAFLTTNSSNANLDVPKTLDRLEEAKGLPLGKYFSSQALFDSSSQAYTLSNPAQYVNSNVRVGANIFVIDRGLTSAKAFIYTGSLRSQANSSDDSVLIELRGRNVADMVAAYLDRIGAVSVVASNTGDTSTAGAVVINEINWAGSYSNSTTSDADDDFVELYNTTSAPINISKWAFACTAGANNLNTYFVMPSGAVIPAGGYFTVARKTEGAFKNSTYFVTTSTSIITPAVVECKLTNGPADPSPLPLTYVAVVGTLMDTAGDNATPFENSGNILGTNDSTGKIRRSMERKFPIAAGNVLTSWQSNFNAAAQNTQIDSQFNQRTFGTPGAATSVPVPSVTLNRSLYFTTSATPPNGVAKITAVNTAANTNISTPQEITVNASSTSDAMGITLTLRETGTNTGIFSSNTFGTNLNFTAGASAGNQLQVASGDTVTITLTQSGSTYTATARWYAQNLVINEIGSNCGGVTANDYVEVLNPNAQTVSLDGMTLYRDAGSSGTACTIDIPNGQTYTSSIALSGNLAANSYALAAGSTYTAGGGCPAPNFSAASAVTIDASDCVALVLSGAGPTTAIDDEVVDFVGYGNAANPREGAAVATDMAGGNNQCISRNPNATDTNENGADFAAQSTLPCSPRGANGSLNLLSATTGNSTVVQLAFNGAPNLAQAQTTSNYCVAPASAENCSSTVLSISAAVLSGSTVTLTTSAQTVGTAYTVYASNLTLAATGGALLNSTANFNGAPSLPVLKINEIGVTSSGSNDFVEIHNPGATAIDLAAAGIHIQRDSACNPGNGITGTHALTGTIAAGGYYVIAETGNSLTNVNQTGLGAIASTYCVILTTSNAAVTLPTSPNVIDWVTIAGTGDTENGVRAPDTGSNGAISRIPNGNDTDNNANDFVVRAATPGLLNGTPTYASTPANAASGIAVAANVVITFSESMNPAVGTVSLSGTTSGAQNGLPCTWSTSVFANDRCTIDPPTDFANNGENVTVTLASFSSQALSLAPAPLTFQFSTVNVGLTPTVTNVVVTSTSPNNGTTPFNTGTTIVTITGTNFTGTSCPTAVRLTDPATTAASACTVDSSTQITATFPAGIRTNGTTGWNVQVMTVNGTNVTSAVTFKPVTGLLINEVIFNASGTANDDAVEIINLTAGPVDLAALNANLQRDSSCNLAGGVTSKLALTGTIAANSYYVIAVTAGSFAGAAQQTGLTSFASGDCLGLTVSATDMTSPANAVFDFVAFGRTVTDKENNVYAPGATATGAGSISRCANGTDTDNNYADFIFRGTAGYSMGSANSCGNDPRGLKINEVVWNTAGGTAANNDMVEIFNTTGAPIDLGLAGVYLRRDGGCTINGGGAHTEDLPLTGTIPANGYYTISGPVASIYSPTAAQQFAANSLTSNYCALLTQGTEIAVSATNLHIIDFVGWGTITDSEGGVSAPGSTSPNSIQRCPNGTDTNNNSNDFMAGGTITQGAANSCP